MRLEVATTAAGAHVVDNHLRQLGVERELLRVVSAQCDRAARSAAGDVPVRVTVLFDRLVPSGTPDLFTDDPAARRVQALLDAVRGGRYGAPVLLWERCGDPYGPYTGAKISFQSFPDIARLRWLGVVPRARIDGSATMRRAARVNSEHVRVFRGTITGR